jgi:hypothetical protein
MSARAGTRGGRHVAAAGSRAEAFVKEMDARCLPLPHADATVLSQVIATGS